jgi:ABC-2 type transport system permease protein
MTATWVIFKKEFRGYFNSPIAYIFLVIFLALSTGYYFLVKLLDDYAHMGDFFDQLPVAFMLFVPALTMRLWAEEKKSGTEELLLTLPMRNHEIVLGKFLASFALIGVALALTLSVPLTIASMGNLDWGPVTGGYLGALLLGATYLAIGLFLSSLTTNQILAFLLSLLACFVLVSLGEPMLLVMLGPAAPIAERLSATYHFRSISVGQIDTRDLVYFVSFIVFFLYLNIASLEARKWK